MTTFEAAEAIRILSDLVERNRIPGGSGLIIEKANEKIIALLDRF